MSVIYKILYRVGFTPWEGSADQARTREQISAMFDREEEGRQPPYGPPLDLGCGGGLWSIELARRGWQVTGVDIVPKALRIARERAETLVSACGSYTATWRRSVMLMSAPVSGYCWTSEPFMA
jgi:SAM-dependent methyltransferase